MRLSRIALLLLSVTLCEAFWKTLYTLNITSPQIYAGVMDAFQMQDLTLMHWAAFSQNVSDRVQMRLALPPTGHDTACCLPLSCNFNMSLPQTLREWEAMQGSLLLIRRGDCNFHLKLLVAQSFGAAGAVVINNDDSPLRMADSDGLPAVSIPGFAIGRTLGEFLEVTVRNSAVSVWVELAIAPGPELVIVILVGAFAALPLLLVLACFCRACCRARSRRLARTTVQLDVLQPAHRGSFGARQTEFKGMADPNTAPANPSCAAALSRTGSLPKGPEATYAMPHAEGGLPAGSPVVQPAAELKPNSRPDPAVLCHSPSKEEWKSLV